MDRQEAVKELKKIAGNMGIEEAHIRADAIVIALLRDLGYEDVESAWMAIEKWYA